METATTVKTSVHSLNKAFTKIYKGLEPEYVTRMEEEMLKIVPSDESEVFLKAGYDEEENTCTFNVYVSKPKKTEIDNLHFDDIVFQWLLMADVEQLPSWLSCINYMERAEGDLYEIDGIPTHYNEDLGDFYFHFSITIK